MLVYIADRDDEEFSTHRAYAYVYEYDDDNYEDAEDFDKESSDYEINYEICEKEYLVS